MKYILIGILVFSLTGLFLWIKARPAIAYKKGDKIKNYRLTLDDDSEIQTGSFLGKWVVIYFYPKDDTPGCTKEAETFSSMLADFKKANAEVFGLNTDTPESHRAFIKKYNLTVRLLSSKDNKIMDDFGVRVMAGFCSRDSILINPRGEFEAEFRGVTPASHPAEILKYIQDHSG